MEDTQGRKRTGRLSRRWAELERMSKDQLIRLVLELEGRLGPGTDPFQQPQAVRSFGRELSWEPKEYISLPTGCPDAQTPLVQPPWRVVMVSFDLAHPVIGLDVYGDVVIGRSANDTHPDLDLTPYDGLGYGVSRQHALLHPADDRLFITDLNSINGTRVNTTWLTPFEPYVLHKNDLVAFGGLLFQFRIIGRVEVS